MGSESSSPAQSAAKELALSWPACIDCCACRREFFRHRNVGDLQLRFGALDELRAEIQQLLEGGLLRLALTSIYILFMLRISVKLTALALVVAALILLPTALIGLQARPLQRHQEEAEGQAQSRNLELISSVSKLRLAGAETAAARWWGQEFQKIVALENALDAKEATAALLRGVMPNLGTLLLYIVITRLIAEAASSPSLNAPNVGQQAGDSSAFRHIHRLSSWFRRIADRSV